MSYDVSIDSKMFNNERNVKSSLLYWNILERLKNLIRLSREVKLKLKYKMRSCHDPTCQTYTCLLVSLLKDIVHPTWILY